MAFTLIQLDECSRAQSDVARQIMNRILEEAQCWAYAMEAQTMDFKEKKEALDKAELIMDVLEEWFDAIEDGTANDRMPDLMGKRYSEEEIDSTIRSIDLYFEGQLHNLTYWAWQGEKGREYVELDRDTNEFKVMSKIEPRGVPIDTPPEFNRIEGIAREAFVQDVKAKMEEVYGSNS